MNRAKARLESWGRSVASIGAKVAGLGAAITAPFTAAAGLFQNAGSELLHMSQRTGASVEALSALSFAAEQAGVSGEGLEHGLRHMQRSIAEASGGSAEAAAALTALGVPLRDLAGGDAAGQVARLADGLAKVGDPAQRAALAMRLFGRGGTELLPLLNLGSAGIAELVNKAGALGVVMSTEDAVAADELRKSAAALWAQLKSAAVAVGSALVPALQELAGWVSPIVKGFADWLRNNKGLVITVASVGAGLVGLGGALTAVGAVVTGVGTAFGVLASAIGVLLNPITLAVGAVVGLGYALYRTGAAGRALDYLKQQFPQIGSAVEYVSAKFGELKDTASEAWGGISAALQNGDLAGAAEIAFLGIKVAWLQLTEDLAQPWADVKAAILAGWAEVGAWAEQKMTTVRIAFSEMTAFASEEWARLVNYLTGVWDEWGGKASAAASAVWEKVRPVWDTMKGYWTRLVSWLAEVWDKWSGRIVAALKPVLVALAAVNPAAGVALAALGELANSETGKNFSAHVQAAGERDATEGEAERQGIADARDRRLEEIEAGRAGAGDAHHRDLEEARKALAGAVKAQKDRLAEKVGPAGARKIAGTAAQVRRHIDTAGTFSATVAGRLGLGSSIAERTAAATERSADLLQGLNDKADEGNWP